MKHKKEFKESDKSDIITYDKNKHEQEFNNHFKVGQSAIQKNNQKPIKLTLNLQPTKQAVGNQFRAHKSPIVMEHIEFIIA